MCLGHWNQVSFRATADFASGPAASDRERLTQIGHSRFTTTWRPSIRLLRMIHDMREEADRLTDNGGQRLVPRQ